MIVFDTGPLYAVSDRDDAHHEECLALFDLYEPPFVVPQTVVTETCWMLEQRLGSEYEARFLEAFTMDELRMEALTSTDISRIAELVRQYGDFPLGTVDASVIAIAERLGVTDIATLDRRHFSVVRPSHTDAFHLLPV